jgi:hypothetical protein
VASGAAVRGNLNKEPEKENQNETSLQNQQDSSSDDDSGGRYRFRGAYLLGTRDITRGLERVPGFI